MLCTKKKTYKAALLKYSTNILGIMNWTYNLQIYTHKHTHTHTIKIGDNEKAH